MKNFIKGFLFLVLISVTFAGCKLDPPVYPQDILQNGTITYTIDGTNTTTITEAVEFDAILPGGITTETGLQILGGTDNPFTLITAGFTPGEYPITIISIGNLQSNDGTITITTFDTTDGKTGTLKGTFVADLTDIDTGDTFTGVTGTFEITQ